MLIAEPGICLITLIQKGRYKMRETNCSSVKGLMLMCAMCLALVTGQVQRALGAELAVCYISEDVFFDVQ